MGVAFTMGEVFWKVYNSALNTRLMIMYSLIAALALAPSLKSQRFEDVFGVSSSGRIRLVMLTAQPGLAIAAPRIPLLTEFG